MIVQESGEHEGGDDGEVLGQRAVLAPLEVDAQEVAGHGNDVKADGFERVAHFVGVAAGLALGSCAPLGTKCTTEGEATAARRFAFHLKELRQQRLPYFGHRR